MTSVPKPLKFLRPHYPDLQILYDAWPLSEDKVGSQSIQYTCRSINSHLAQSLFADILSVLAMTYSDTQPRGTLRYRLLSASLRPSDSPLSDPGSWGHEYVRHLSAELGEEFTAREEEPLQQPSAQEDQPKTQLPGTMEDLRDLARQCAKFLLSHNAEPDAVDLFEEMEIIGDIANLVDENTYGRVCQYMIR